jgi:thioesterase domain-containing protein/acyl carrier protein
MAPVAFDASTFEIWGPLLNGARLAIAPDGAMGPKEVARTMERFDVTSIWLTTSLFNQVVEHEPSALGRLRQLLTGGEMATPELIARALDELPAGAILVNGYGPTESTTFATCHRMQAGSPIVGAPPIGRPIANTRVYITDEDGELVPPGATGEILIGGDGLALGYLGDPVLSTSRFVPDRFGPDPGNRLYRTGDRARWRPDGTVEFLGRIDRQIKVRGFRVEPEAVERTLLEHPSVREAFVLAQDLPEGRRLVAYVTPAIDEATKGLIRDALRQTLAAYEVPSFIVSVDTMPLNANGKVDQSELPPPSEQEALRAQASGPLDPLEHQLLEIWRDVLQVRAIDPDDDFFDSGGHSLLAVSLFARIENEMGIRLPLSTIFESPTVRELAGVLRFNGWDAPWRTLSALTTTGTRHPLFFVTAGDGNSVGFGALARRLGPDQPFYALQPRGMDGRRLFEVRVQAIARHYVREIRAVQSSGPYFLGGRCFGTLVAFEMARILEAAGEQVPLLIALDSVGPLWKQRMLANGIAFDEVMNLARCLDPDAPPSAKNVFTSSDDADAFVAWLREPADASGVFTVNRYLHTAYKARPDLQAAYPLAGGQHAGLLYWAWVGGRSEMGMNPDLLPDPSPDVQRAPQSRDPRYRSPARRLRARSADWLDVATRGGVRALAARRQERVLELAARMVLEYRAGPCAARVALFRSAEYRNDATLARWYGVETAGIEEHFVTGSHLSMMREPDVAALARSIEALVADA